VALPVFYYDLGDPECYLMAEQLKGEAEWEPVLARELGLTPRGLNRDQMERRAHELGLQPVRWPNPWPPDTHRAMLAATYAKRIGRGVSFSLAAFRQAFAGGADLGSEDTIMLAGAASEMHPSALIKGMSLRTTTQALATAIERARRDGVTELPAVLGAR
jgi:2-hydroxychromene-2-carboxylate isomerase